VHDEDTDTDHMTKSAEPVVAHEVGAASAHGHIIVQRAYQRVHLEVSVDIESESNFYTGITSDLSEGGVFVAMDPPLAPGALVSIDLQLPPPTEKLQLNGEVRWVREFGSSSEGLPPGCGIKWFELAPDTAAAITRFVRLRDTIFYDED
jgi:uncharacterized protein (TIGR02266 family)